MKDFTTLFLTTAIKDLNTNSIVYNHRGNNCATPASTMKLVTTATALEMLGPDFCFKTKLEMDGEITTDSVLNGNLYIHGGGDPTLGSAYLGDTTFLAKWVEEVKKAGVKSIKGSVIADATLYDDEGVNSKWTWEDMGNYYAAGSYGISYLDNTYRLVLRTSKVGTTPEILRTIPKIPSLIFDNQLKSASINFDSAYFHGAPHANLRTITGKLPANKTEFIIKGDIPNPAPLLAQHFDEKLHAAGIETTPALMNKVVSKAPHKLLYAHLSPTLREIITVANVRSNNQYAEQLFRYLSLTVDTVASSKNAALVVKQFWKSKGLDVSQLFMYDGSGLSPEDAVSSRFFVELLTYMKTKSPHSELFLQSLPVAGESGTVSSFLKGTPLQGKVFVKSGTIARVKCYAGYMDSNNKNYAFALMVNYANGSTKSVVKKMEEFLLSIDNSPLKMEKADSEQ
jgi:serine-type D-Ala-D-Ala carboxypeptidase/endopeptidase (penicillin-binding protein 4)